MKHARRLIGLVLVVAAFFMLRERAVGLNFLAQQEQGLVGLLLDPVYLLPGLGAVLGCIGGFLALAGQRALYPSTIGVGLVVLCIVLIGGISGRFSMIEPFLYPAIIMLIATVGLFALKPK